MIRKLINLVRVQNLCCKYSLRHTKTMQTGSEFQRRASFLNQIQVVRKYRTIQNLEVIKSDIENNLIYIKGSIPGSKNSTILIQKNKKKINRTTTLEASKKLITETSKTDTKTKSASNKKTETNKTEAKKTETNKTETKKTETKKTETKK